MSPDASRAPLEARRLGPRAAWTGPLSRGDYDGVACHLEGLQRFDSVFADAYAVLNQLAEVVLSGKQAEDQRALQEVPESKNIKAKATGSKG